MSTNYELRITNKKIFVLEKAGSRSLPILGMAYVHLISESKNCPFALALLPKKRVSEASQHAIYH